LIEELARRAERERRGDLTFSSHDADTTRDFTRGLGHQKGARPTTQRGTAKHDLSHRWHQFSTRPLST
jgi:hypothetical protein